MTTRLPSLRAPTSTTPGRCCHCSQAAPPLAIWPCAIGGCGAATPRPARTAAATTMASTAANVGAARRVDSWIGVNDTRGGSTDEYTGGPHTGCAAAPSDCTSGRRRGVTLCENVGWGHLRSRERRLLD